MTALNATTTHVDFATRAAVNVTGSDERGQQSTTGYSAYLQQVRKYPGLAYSWDVSYPVPKDLLLPFSDFIVKYNLSDVSYDIFQGGSGFANILQQPTIDAMKIVGDSYIASIQGGAVRTTDHSNQEIYDKALSKLGKDVLLQSTVASAQRLDGHGDASIKLVVKGASGGNKLVQAKKLLISVPPLLSNRKTQFVVSQFNLADP